jgi:hypothetical protein
VEALRERVEADIDRVLAPLFEALTATRAVVVGNGPSAYVDAVDDFPTRIVAVRELLDRAYDKPRSAVNVLTRDEFMDRVAEMEAEFVELDEQLAVAEGSSNSCGARPANLNRFPAAGRL